MLVVENNQIKHQEELAGTKVASKQEKENQTGMDSKEANKDFFEERSTSNIYDTIYSMVGKGASTNIGQFTIEKIDGLLSVIEKTAKWSVSENIKDSKSISDKSKDNKLERPCGWLSFLTLIIAIRIARIGLSFGALIIGNEPVTPESVVTFLQTRRRKLRAIRIQGLRALHLKDKSCEEKAKQVGIIKKLKSPMNLAVCCLGKTNDCSSITSSATSSAAIDSFEQKLNISNNKFELNLRKLEPAQKRPLDQDDDSANQIYSDEELFCTQLLDKYGNNVSDDDSDYVPQKKEEIDSSSNTSEDDVDYDEEISEEELINIQFVSENEKESYTSPNNSTIKENGPTGTANENKKTPSSENGEKSNTLNNHKSLSTSSISSPKSTDINSILVSPKIAQNGTSGDEIYENFYDPVEAYDYDVQKGLRLRCQDLARFSGGEECFYSPLGSPSLNDYQQLQLPSVSNEKVPLTAPYMNNSLNQITNDNRYS